jgi:hypothetical protein
MIDYKDTEIKLIFLTHREFRNSPYWEQVRHMADIAYERDKMPGESLAGYRKAFMRGIKPGQTGRKHFLLVHEKTQTALSHHNAISTYKPDDKTAARLGHMLINPNITVNGGKLSNYHIDTVLVPYLKGMGFKTAKGSHYSIIGAVIGEKKGFRGYALTKRGELYCNMVKEKGPKGIVVTIRGRNYGPELLLYYQLKLSVDK